MEKNEKNESKYYETFCGHQVSEYGLQRGYLDYATLAQCFDAILCNEIERIDRSIWEHIESGSLSTYYYDGEEVSYDEYWYKKEELEDAISEEEDETKREELERDLELFEEREKCIYQFFLVSDNAIRLLREANELVLYSELLDLYVWCIDHFGSPWRDVLTSIKLREKGE